MDHLQDPQVKDSRSATRPRPNRQSDLGEAERHRSSRRANRRRAKRVRPRRGGVQPIEFRGEGNEARDPVDPLHAKTSDVLRQRARWPELRCVSREPLAEVPETPVQLLFDGRTPGESLGEGLIAVVPFTAPRS
jgi:hypothetical protein